MVVNFFGCCKNVRFIAEVSNLTLLIFWDNIINSFESHFGGKNMNIKNLKQFRKSKGYTLSELGSMLGCTSSHLSQLERGLKQPSLEMLRRISNCLEIPIIDFLSDNDTCCSHTMDISDKKYDIIRNNNRKKFTMPEINTEYECITPYSADGSDNSRIIGMYIKLMPGKWSCEKPISLNFDFNIFVIQGTLNALIEQDTLTLENGDSVYIYSGKQHNFYNAGDTELILLGFGERNTPHNVNL